MAPARICPICSAHVPVSDRETGPAVACPLCGSSVPLEGIGTGVSDSDPTRAISLGGLVEADMSASLGGELGETVDGPSARRDESPETLVGMTFGGCKIEELIATGGMGAVYKAWQESLEVHVAVKTILAKHENAKVYVDRFEREAKVTARFRSPYVVKIKDTGFEQDIYYLIMEYVEGQDLESFHKQQPDGVLSPEQALKFLKDAATGLLEAEHLQVVHRDIKPANLLLTLSKGVPEVVRIADFGVLRDMGEGTASLSSGIVPSLVGTPMFMAPEQLRMDPVDHRCDMWALGASFFYMLTSKLPATGTDFQELRTKRMDLSCLSPRKKRPDIPRELNRIIEKMTAREPDDRYASFQDVIDAVEKASHKKLPKAAVVAMVGLPLIVAGAGAWAFFRGPAEVVEIAMTQEKAIEKVATHRASLGAPAGFERLEQAVQANLATMRRSAAGLPESDDLVARHEQLGAKIAANLAIWSDLDVLLREISSSSPPYDHRVDNLPLPQPLDEFEEDLRSLTQEWTKVEGLLARYDRLRSALGEESAGGQPGAFVERVKQGKWEATGMAGLQTKFAELEEEYEELQAEWRDEYNGLCTMLKDHGPDPALEVDVAALLARGEQLGEDLADDIDALRQNLEDGRVVRENYEKGFGPLPELPFDGLRTYLRSIETVLVGGGNLGLWARKMREEERDRVQSELFALAEAEWNRCSRAHAFLRAGGAPSEKTVLGQELKDLQDGIRELGRQWSDALAAHEVLRAAAAALPELRESLVVVEAATPEAVLPADWAKWARDAWPMEFAAPAGLRTSSVAGDFTWEGAPDRIFRLVVQDAERPFLIERELVSAQACYRYFSRGLRRKMAIPDPAQPIRLVQPQEALEFAKKAVAADMALPTARQLELARNQEALVATEFGEMVRPVGAVVSNVRVEGIELELGQQQRLEWSGDQEVGFRCCYELSPVRRR